ncbi:MAG: radical SAM family heme chaperone HemW, partial [Spirochaetia bacterium]
RKLEVPLSLYVHIPFCRKKCDYCDFFSIDSADSELKEKTIEKTLEDTEEFLSILSPPLVETVYIGGGTPNSLPNTLFSKLLRRIRRLFEQFGTPLEWTLEANPEFLSIEQLELMENAGVSRISLGVQSFENEKLALIGRRSSAEDAERALSLLSKKWRGDWSADLITLLPKDGSSDAYGLSSSESDIDKILSYSPDHLSLYGLTVEPETPLYNEVKRGAVLLPEEGAGADYLRRLWNILKNAGFFHYEVSNFSRTREKESLHNFRYWRMSPYLGVGPSAVSTLPGQRGPMRLLFSKDLEQFNYDSDYRIDAEQISPYSFLLEHLLTGLRTREGVSFARMARIFGAKNARRMFRKLEPKLKLYESNGFIDRPGDNTRDRRLMGGNSKYRDFRATDSGLMILDSLILDLSVELDKISPDRSRWP